MLTHLQIRDFAIIDAVELELRPGLTVLTGETGAGKSILVDALQLLAGGRAGAEVVRHGAERAEIAATFEISQAPRELKQWLEEQTLGGGTELVVRRVIGSDGRSRAYLNGQSVPVQLLREAGSILIDIHGQHEFQSLTRSAAQRELLDGYGSLTAAVSQVGIAHRVWLELLNRTLALEGQARDRDAKLELLRYQVKELAALQLQPGEAEALIEEAARLANRGRLAAGSQAALGALYEGEQPSAHGLVSRAVQSLRTLAALDPKLAALVPLLEEAAVHLREAARELEALERADTDLADLRRELGAALQAYRALAQQLSGKRMATARVLARDISGRMQTLGMGGGRFEADVTQDGNAEPAQHGIDQVEFRVTANPGSPPRALAKVASGGELSRLSLAVQVACAAQDPRCMVFDEVDAGIGGAVAEIVGRELRALAVRSQVLCVTHLAQVACQAHHHLRVTKVTDGRSTRITLAELEGDDRIEELARMLGGVEITAKAREHARDMLSAATLSAGKTAVSARGSTGADAADTAKGEDTVRQPRPPAARRR